MVHLYRLTVALLVLLCSTAYASFPASSTSGLYCSGGGCQNGGSPYTGTTLAQWCASFPTVFGAGYTSTLSGRYCTVYRYGNQDSIQQPDYTRDSVESCPANATLSGSSCTCNSGYVENGGTCQSATAASGAQDAVDELNRSGDQYCTTQHQVTGLGACAGGFAVRGSRIATGTGRNTDGTAQQCIQGPFTTSGYPCGETDTNMNGDGNCKAGKVPGTVNGVPVCVTPGTTSTTTSSTGGTSTSTTGSSGGAPTTSGSTTGSTTDATCIGGNCTSITKTTTTNPDGTTSVTTTSKTEPQASFCKDNPASPLCVQSSVSAKACGTPDVCTGDAVACAINAQAKITACAFQNTAAVTAEEDRFTAAKGKTGDQTTGDDVNTTFNVGPSSFDQTNILGAAAGVSDLTVTVVGKTITLPLSNVNPWLAMLGNLAVAITALLCMRIVARG